MWAVIKGQTPCVKLLLEAKADVNLKDNQEKTALFWGIRVGNLEIVKDLIAAKADINMVMKVEQQEVTPLICAAALGNVDITIELIQAGAKINLNDIRIVQTIWKQNTKISEDVKKEILTILKDTEHNGAIDWGRIFRSERVWIAILFFLLPILRKR